jgi:hypothetical protein
MWRKLAIAVALFVIPFAANPASAQQGGDEWGPPHGGGGMHEMHGRGMGGMDGGMGGMFGPGLFLRGVPLEGPLAEQLALTGTQREQLTEIKDRAKRDMITLGADFKIAHLDLQKAVENDAKTADLDAAVNRVTAAHAALLKSRVHQISDERSILTTAQRRTLETYKPERKNRQK